MWMLEYEWNDYDDRRQILFGAYSTLEGAEEAKQELVDRVLAHVTRTPELKKLWEERPHRNVENLLRRKDPIPHDEMLLEMRFREVDGVIDSIFVWEFGEIDADLQEADIENLLTNLWRLEEHVKES